jgi:succinoglycan biosynthesis protein ExoL
MLLPVQSHVRFWKRAEGLERLGARVRVFSFERPWYEGRAPQKEWTSLGTLAHRNYLKRIPALFRAVRIVRAAVEPDDVVYAFGLDLLAVGWLATLGRRRNGRVVLEIGDIRRVMLARGIASRVLRTVERFLLRRTDVVVCTTQAFIDGYFIGRQKAVHPAYLAIENRLAPEELSPRASARRARSDQTITIGYFGILRCQRSWEVLKRLAATPADRFRVIARGVPFGIPTLETDVAAGHNLEFGGPYVSPADLVSMYSQVDMIWVAYPAADQNHRWARTNRSYEAGYFGKPIIAQRGTGDGAFVEREGIGLLVDLEDIDATTASVRAVTARNLETWEEHLSSLDSSNFVLTDEHERLCDALCKPRGR